MTDWAAGDLALIVRDGPIQCPRKRTTLHAGFEAPRKGSIRKVQVVGCAVGRSIFTDGLSHCGCTTLHFGDNSQASEHRCVKITPDEPDAEDAETIRLLNSAPVELPEHTNPGRPLRLSPVARSGSLPGGTQQLTAGQAFSLGEGGR